MKRFLVFLCAMLLFFGVTGNAMAVPVYALDPIFDADPYGHDYWIFIYGDSMGTYAGDLDDKAWTTVNALFAGFGTEYYLATITSQAEQDTIADYIANSGATGQFWLGGQQLPPDETDQGAGWNWVTGETWHYTNWNNGEPNDNYGEASEQWLAMWGSNWKWNDELNLGNITGFIIEYGDPAPIPEPATMLLLGSGLIGLAGFSRKKFKK